MARSNLQQIKAALEEFGPDGNSFLVGEPWFGPGKGVKDALSTAAEEAELYSTPGGLAEMKDKICQLERSRGLNIGPENVIVGNGSKGLLFGLMALRGGGGVASPLPSYPPMLLQPGMQGQKSLGFSTLETDGVITASQLKELNLEDGMLVYSSPANPTGKVISRGEQELLLKWAEENNNMVVADEVYCDFVFGKRAESLAELRPDLKNVAIVRSFSKSLGICGWRMGYMIAAADVIEPLTRWQTLALNPPSTLVQKALASLPVEELKASSEHREFYRSLARDICQILDQKETSYIMPQGGFYLFIDLREMLKSNGFTSSTELCKRLARDLGIGLWPGEDFGVPGWARLAFGNIKPESRNEQLEILKNRINKFIPFLSFGC